MARQISLNDREYIEIVNSKKEVTGGFWWNPSDLDIVKRCEKVMKFFEDMKIPEQGGEAAIFAVSDTIKEQFDYLISPGASEELFKHCNPLSPREDGTLYAEYVLSVIVKFIESEMNVRVKKTTSRIDKYTKKYEKK
jgi:hypothetical protein